MFHVRSLVWGMFVLLVGGVSLAGNSLRAEGARVEKLSGEFKFTEGPASDAEGNVLFTDQPNNRIMKWSIDGKEIADTATEFEHTFNDPGPHTVSLTVKGSDDKETSAEASVVVEKVGGGALTSAPGTAPAPRYARAGRIGRRSGRSPRRRRTRRGALRPVDPESHRHRG